MEEKKDIQGLRVPNENEPVDKVNEPRRIILIGKELVPFDEEKYFLGPSGFSRNFIAPIGLEIEGRVFPIRIAMELYNLPSDHSLTPLNPELGYKISAEDFGVKSREQKLRSQPKLPEPQNRLDKSELDSKRFTYLQIKGIGSILNESRLNEDLGYNSYRFPKKTLELLRRLRVIVNVSTETFEGKPSELYLSGGEIKFDEFYPQQTGPLAALKKTYEESREADRLLSIEEMHLQYTLTMEGLLLAFPNELEKLKQIKLKFVLADKKTKEKIQDRGGEK